MAKLKQIPKHYFLFFLIAGLLMIPGVINHGIHGDDATFHITNIMAMGKHFNIFSFPTRIRPLIANNFGYGSGIFYPELFHVIVLYMWKFLNIFHIPLSATIVFFLFLFVSVTAITMYHLLFQFTKQKKYSIFGAIIYITYPYFLTDIYSRSAYGELISFLALPLAILGIYYLLYKDNPYKFYLYFIFSYYLLISSHLISIVYTTLFIVVFLLFHIKEVFQKKKIISFLIASCFIIGFSLNTIIPILEHKLATSYMVFVPGHMFSKKVIMETILSARDLLLPDMRIAVYLPIFITLLLIFFGIRISKVKESVPSKILYSIIVMFFLSILLLTCTGIWKILPSIFITIQFVWRNCIYLGFTTSILVTFGLMTVPYQWEKTMFTIISILVVLTTIIFLVDTKYVPNKNVTFSYRDGGMGWEKEYLPERAYQNINYFNKRKENIKMVNKSDAKIKIIENHAPNLTFTIEESKNTKVELPRIYYLWYEITLVDKTNIKQKLSYYENDKGFIEVNIPKSGVVDVKYKKTFLSKGSEVVYLLSIVGFCILLKYSKKEKI